MKRLQDRDTPPKMIKRSRSSASQFEDSPRDHLSPERDRGPRSPSHGSTGKPTSVSSRHGKNRAGSGTGSGGGTPDRKIPGLGRGPHDGNLRDGREDYPGHGMPRNYDKEYRILCISGVHHRVNENTVRETLFREFKKFGDIDVKSVLDNGERFYYVYFRTPEDAREARIMKGKLFLFEKPVLVEPVFEAERRGRPPRGSTSPDLMGPYPGKLGRVRGVSPTHSTSSSSSLQRRSRRSSPLSSLHGPFRRDEGLLPLAHPHPDFLAPHNNAQNAVRRHDDKKEKFPNYLHHIPPEEDDKANRTLFVGNLEVNITEPELRRIFERYGVVEDIDIKRPPPGQGNAYAFVKFLNLDMAHKSKVEMSGQYIGKFQCKIGYGKPIPTTRIWVGGLGPWTSLSHLEREFDRFGAIKKIDFVKGDNHAYILYDSIDAAQAACKEMRGFPLGGPNKRLRVDFADAGPYSFHHQGGATTTPRPPPTAYAAEEDSYYRRRIDHEHLGLRSGTAADPYYYGGSSRDPEYARWASGSGYPPTYEPYYERGGRGRIHDDWAPGYERERDHDSYRNWSRDYPNWREGGGPPRDWVPGEPSRRKRPRSPDDLHYDAPPDGPYRRYARQRTPPDGLADVPPLGRRRRSPSLQMRMYRSPDPLRDRDGTPPLRPPASLMRDRRRSRSLETGVDGAERERTRFLNDVKTENGRSRDTSSATSAPPASTLVLPEGDAERLVNAANISEVARILPLSWQGGLVLKNSYFPVKMHACDGDAHLIDNLTKGVVKSEAQVLRISQRLRLDQPKLDDVSKRLAGNGFCVLLGLASSVDEQPVGPPVQTRPLRNLVSYLKQKEAAGVIPLSSGKEVQGVLYAFPPCHFSQERLRRIAPSIPEEGLKEDHLMIAVVRDNGRATWEQVRILCRSALGYYKSMCRPLPVPKFYPKAEGTPDGWSGMSMIA